jgi:hypothetical protein
MYIIEEDTYCCGGQDGLTFAHGTSFENGACTGETCTVGVEQHTMSILCEGHPTKQEQVVAKSCTCFVTGFHKLVWFCQTVEAVHEDFHCCDGANGEKFDNGGCTDAQENVAAENRCPQTVSLRGFRRVPEGCGSN